MGDKTKTVLYVYLLAFVQLTFAGEQTGIINILYAKAHDNLHYVSLKNATTRTGAPDCAQFSYWMVKDEDSAAGKTQISMLLAAQMAGKKVTIIGSNTCDRWHDGEDISYIKILDD